MNYVDIIMQALQSQVYIKVCKIPEYLQCLNVWSYFSQSRQSNRRHVSVTEPLHVHRHKTTSKRLYLKVAMSYDSSVRVLL